MIRLQDMQLTPTVKLQLNRWQSEIDGLPDYADRVAAAERRFKQKNRANNPTFKAVRNELDRTCVENRRCDYCEDSAADEVEHVKPKTLYPEDCFRPRNYGYACGPCNGPKNNHFAVFAGPGRAVIDVSRRRGAPVVPPVAGDPLLLSPRLEDPLALLQIDLMLTFFFEPRAPRGTEEYERAKYTIDILGLNERAYLPKQRREYHGNYLARLKDYVSAQQKGDADRRRLVRIATGIQHMAHPSVWSEMKRQHKSFPELARLFAQAPEALRL
jgi:hypothetical protein